MRHRPHWGDPGLSRAGPRDDVDEVVRLTRPGTESGGTERAAWGTVQEAEAEWGEKTGPGTQVMERGVVVVLKLSGTSSEDGGFRKREGDGAQPARCGPGVGTGPSTSRGQSTGPADCWGGREPGGGDTAVDSGTPGAVSCLGRAHREAGSPRDWAAWPGVRGFLLGTGFSGCPARLCGGAEPESGEPWTCRRNPQP